MQLKQSICLIPDDSPLRNTKKFGVRYQFLIASCMVFIFSAFCLNCLPGQCTTVRWLKGEARPQCVSGALVVTSLDLAITGHGGFKSPVVAGGGDSFQSLTISKPLLLIIWWHCHSIKENLWWSTWRGDTWKELYTAQQVDCIMATNTDTGCTGLLYSWGPVEEPIVRSPEFPLACLLFFFFNFLSSKQNLAWGNAFQSPRAS